MNLFLTGITGFCGSHVARRLLHAGHSVWALARKSLATPRTPDVAERLNIVVGDLPALAALPPLTEAIIHIAAVSPGDGTTTSEFVQSNILGTERLLYLARQSGVRKFIFFSSISLYGEIRIPVVDEGTPILNPGPYGVSKLVSEMLMRDLAKETDSIALRLPGVLGRGASRHWLSTLTERARNGCDLRVFNPESPFNNAVHIDDLNDLIERLLRRDWSGFDAVTLGARGSLTISEIANRVARAAPKPVRVIAEPSSRSSFTISSERAMAVYGYQPMEFDKMLNQYLHEALQ